LETLDHCAAFDAASQHHQRTIAANDPEIGDLEAGQSASADSGGDFRYAI